ncbi:DUF4136 domain-containing protein [Novosphingobium sp. FSY-8]|uniref:DUF4136 domain-containing protein n=1 Tax=Novosphingobium ovatum TaxID=1908523 RepID=A0ABW9XDI3_9SPHN|nr:DUF4136 domain-containing protein [Novosphingobium ovatum]NBC36527.1 DUF4136 domain-containing protein [Novosphingobium ovatum]
MKLTRESQVGRRAVWAGMVMGLLALGGCMVPTPPVEVSRFHAAEAGVLGRGAITVVAAPAGTSLPAPAPLSDAERASWHDAVRRELARLGYDAQLGDPALDAPRPSSGQIAQVRVIRQTIGDNRTNPRVTVGGNASVGSYGSSTGMGVAIRLGGPPSGAQVATDLAVVIRDAASGRVLWEGRASLTLAASAPMAQTAMAAPRLAGALFGGFPGISGQTVRVP